MKFVVLFGSIHQVLRAEKFLNGKGIKIDLVPVPRELSSDCGVAIEMVLEPKGESLFLFEENQIPVSECYARDEQGKYEKCSLFSTSPGAGRK